MYSISPLVWVSKHAHYRDLCWRNSLSFLVETETKLIDLNQRFNNNTNNNSNTKTNQVSKSKRKNKNRLDQK